MHKEVVETKKCTGCGEVKPITAFYKRQSAKDGLDWNCKACYIARSRAHKKSNARRNNLDGVDMLGAKRCPTCGVGKPKSDFTKNVYSKDGLDWQCRKCMANTLAAFKVACPERAEKRRSSSRDYYYNRGGKEKARAWKRLPSTRKRRSARGKERRCTDKTYNLNCNISKSVGGSLASGGKGGRRWESLVGYTLDELKAHLESLFESWMTWDNYGNGWHIDHIIPRSVFNFQTPEDIDFKRCWALSNLQPLEASANLRKHCKLDAPFQPALQLQVD